MLLSKTGFSLGDIIRQWNYIEGILQYDGPHQHYQIFNEIRTKFYGDLFKEKGYPAGTGIGIKRGIKLIQEGKCWTHWLNKYPNVDLETNLELITLPFEADKINLKLPQSYFDKKAWIEIFQKYSLNKLNLADFRNLIDEKKENSDIHFFGNNPGGHTGTFGI